MVFPTKLSALAVAGYIAVTALGHAQQAPQTIFACSLGKKSVSVTASGRVLTYQFGTPGRVEMALTGSKDQGNVHYMMGMFAGAEHQLRFQNGRYNYIVYNLEGKAAAGAVPSAGLVVMDGTKRVADMSCTRYAEFGSGFDYDSLPEDTDAYSAM